MNDPVNFSDKFDALFGINDMLPRFIIFDEAHNLFRNINNTN
jgi:Rad3-related DNA helicase